jgi:hypothetical protein
VATVAASRPTVGGGVDAATLKVSACVAICAGEDESVTLAVKEKLPLWLGVPEITPALDSVKPVGSVPEATLQL